MVVFLRLVAAVRKNDLGPDGGLALVGKSSRQAGNDIGNYMDGPATKGLSRFSSLKTLQLQ
jgi:hypothetical protein